MITQLFNAIHKLHPKLNMYMDSGFIVVNEIDEMLITEVSEMLYSNVRLEKIKDVEWTVVDEYGYMAVRIV